MTAKHPIEERFPEEYERHRARFAGVIVNRHRIEDELPEKYERHRARFVRMTLSEFKRYQGCLRSMRSRLAPENSSPSV